MAIFVTSQFQGIMGVSIAAYLLMRRQSNPFYNADAGVRAGPGQGMVDGLPAPGLLSDLIEGSTKKRSAGRMPNGIEYGPERAIEGVGPQTAEDKMQNSEARRQLAADGAVVRTMSIRTPKRIASWMPRRVRAAVVAQYAEEEEPEGTETPKDGSERPRQLAVPYQNYRRYRA